ncbi:sterol desaturase family protein [Alteromonas sediminis]|uniref:Sterol desaturase family protein n=1 Tax=Alteromonas sediminis TaxID=2259342 RepID=A0A3N5Y110_9ALTE|nr:sterol desaturase family protein [Alteromonas sediminis]RPJ67232.1 sterol desaturase family protein [Alteromonas sediminis]
MNDILRAMTFVVLAGAVFFIVMFIEGFYLKVTRGKSGYYFKETLANMMTGFSYKLVDGLAIALFITAFATYLNDVGVQWQFESKIIEFIVIFVLADLLFYGMHVVAHKVRWFWCVHVTHHSSDHFNFSTALRQNFLYAIQGTWAFQWVPLALLGFDPSLILIAIEINLFYQFFIHTEAIKKLGWAEWIFNTPSHHRVHHGCNKEQIDCNFGGVLIVWDRLFGTFQSEENAGTIRYGVTRMPYSNTNPLYIQVYEVIDLFRDICRYKDLRLLFMHPDWVHQHFGRQIKPTAQSPNELEKREDLS